MAGLENVEEGCCATGRFEMGLMCNDDAPLTCDDASKYLFWDAFHPTERVNVLLGRAAFSGGNDVVYPMNIQQLAAWQP